jgi:hypothetical protein
LSTYKHELEVRHKKMTMLQTFGRHVTDSVVEIDCESSDLTEAWKEVIARMPSDVYLALKEAMANVST